MTFFSLYTRSFHPDRNFGVMGLGFKGDDRGFSYDISATSRIHHKVVIDLKAARLVGATARSDPSSNEVISELLVIRKVPPLWGLFEDGAPNNTKELQENRDDNILFKLPNMENDYSDKRKQPRSKTEGNITKYRADGDQSVNARLSYAGKNFAFYGANTNLGHWILGGNVSDGGEDTSGTSLKFWERWGGVVPDLDVTHEFSLRINRTNKTMHVSSAMSGDSFPNSESFLLNSSGNALFLGSHVRIGSAMFQLPGGRMLPITRTLLTVELLEGDLFGEVVDVDFAIDYTGNGSPHEIMSPRTKTSRSDWNRTHTGRDASGDWLRAIEDDIPLPRQTIRRGKFLMDISNELLRKATGQ